MSDKTVMPEVLPDPELAKSLLDGGPRVRTQNHLRRLATIAALAAGGVGLAGCVGYGVVDPMPEPACSNATAADYTAETAIVDAVWQAGAVVSNVAVGGADSGQVLSILGASAANATVQVAGGSDGAATLTITPAAEADSVDVVVRVQCSDSGGETAVEVTLRYYVSGARIDGTAVSGTVVAPSP